MAGQKKNSGADPRDMLEGIEDKGDTPDPDVSSAETAADDVTAESASGTDSSENGEAEIYFPPETTAADEMVTVRFKNTYTGILGVYHKKKEYTIPIGVAKKLEDDLDYVR